MARNTRSGFTLVELLVVIGIIAMLISILLPALNRARQSASAVACLSNLRQIGIGMQMYAQSHQGHLPVGSYWAAAPINRELRWTALLRPYLGMKEAAAGATEDPNVAPIFLDRDALNPEQVGYAVHREIMKAYGKSRKLVSIREPSERVLAMDTIQWSQNDGSGEVVRAPADTTVQMNATSYAQTWMLWPTPGWFISNNPKPHPGANIDAPDGYAGTDSQIRWRHLNNTTANFLWADGHASSMKYGRNAIGASELEWKHILVDKFLN